MSGYQRLDETGLNTLTQALANATKSKISSEIEQVCKDTVGWTGKNLLKNTATSQTINGVTFTVNADGSVTANGTATSNGAELKLHTFGVNDTVVGKQLTLSGCPTGGGATTYRLMGFRVADASGASGTIFETGEGETFDYLNNIGTGYISLQIRPNYTANNLVFYPMLRRADILDDTYEPYHESVETMYEEEIHGVNLIPYPYWDKTVTKNGITFTMNSDGSVTANGTATGAANYNILVGNGYGYAKNKYIGCIYTALTTQGSNSTYRIIADYSETGTSWKAGDESFNIGEGLVIRNYPYVQIHLYISSGATVNNLVFKPMLRKADIEDSTYRPYNPQAIQNQLNAQGVLGAKNLFDFDTPTVTSQGITFENNEGTIIANGTSSGSGAFPFIECRKTIPAGTYIATGCPSGGGDVVNPDNYQIVWRLNDGAGQILGIDYGDGITFTLDQSSVVNVRCMTSKNMTVNNLTFKPMLRLASDPDDTYQPYAMTNRELTEKVETLKSVRTWDSTTGIVLFKYGNIVTVNFDGMTAVTKGVDEAFFTLPEGYRPRDIIQFVEPLNNRRIVISTNGQISSKVALNNAYIRGYATFIVM